MTTEDSWGCLNPLEDTGQRASHNINFKQYANNLKQFKAEMALCMMWYAQGTSKWKAKYSSKQRWWQQGDTMAAEFDTTLFLALQL